MAKTTRNAIIEAALELLDSEGLDAVTTRKLAQRLHVESAALYWHFKDKATLLQALASAIMLEHHICPPPNQSPADQATWLAWYADNARSFRLALLRYRDGARLHAGTVPGPDELERVTPKVAYLEAAGLGKHEAQMALYTASQFTLGCVLEEQARSAPVRLTSAEPRFSVAGVHPQAHADRGAERAFEFGLKLLLYGLERSSRERENPG